MICWNRNWIDDMFGYRI